MPTNEEIRAQLVRFQADPKCQQLVDEIITMRDRLKEITPNVELASVTGLSLFMGLLMFDCGWTFDRVVEYVQDLRAAFSGVLHTASSGGPN